jgi:hypothetical protein
MAGDKRLTQAEVDQIFSLREKGYRIFHIARMMNINHASVLYRLKTNSRRVWPHAEVHTGPVKTVVIVEPRIIEIRKISGEKKNPGKASYAEYLKADKERFCILRRTQV